MAFVLSAGNQVRACLKSPHKPGSAILIIGIVFLGLAALGLWGAFENLQALYDPRYTNASVNFAGLGVLFNLALFLAFAAGGIILMKRSKKKKD